MTNITETLADVAALIPRYSWEIMDEEQRDDLMENVVLPRYMQTTADGVQLGPTAWADMVGAGAQAIRMRVSRLQQSQNDDDAERTRTLRNQQGSQRHARKVLRDADPEQIADLMQEPSVRLKVRQALAQSEPAPHDLQVWQKPTGPTFIELICKIRDAQHDLDRMMKSWRGPEAVPAEFSPSTFIQIAETAMAQKDRVEQLSDADHDEFQQIIKNFTVTAP